jgi:hypothetical protein
VSAFGFAALNRELKRLREHGPQALAREMYREGEEIMTASKARYVPVDTGTLRSTGHVQQPDIRADGTITVRMVYGGPAAPYALAVHEIPPERAQHPVGQWKYLETPALEASKGLAQRVASRLKFVERS